MSIKRPNHLCIRFELYILFYVRVYIHLIMSQADIFNIDVSIDWT